MGEEEEEDREEEVEEEEEEEEEEISCRHTSLQTESNQNVHGIDWIDQLRVVFNREGGRTAGFQLVDHARFHEGDGRGRETDCYVDLPCFAILVSGTNDST